MKNILVISDPIDQEQTALAKAQELARTTVARLHIVAFCYESLTFAQSDEEGESVKSMSLSRTRQFWESYFNSHSLTSTAAYEVVWEKDLAQWVHQHCESMQYDLIVKSGHRSETVFYTPTDWQLFRESSVPVYCVANQENNDSKPAANKTILVALDLLSKNKEKAALNKQLLEAGFQLAVQTNAKLKCCSAIVIPTLLKDMDLIDIPQREADLKKEIENNAEQLFEDYDLTLNDLSVLPGKSWQIILNVARKKKAECIVLGSMGRSALTSRLIGNTAEKVIHYTDSDLLVISPKQSA